MSLRRMLFSILLFLSLNSSVSQHAFSKITLALFADSGWYEVDYSKADPVAFGLKKGCKLATTSCGEWVETNSADSYPYCKSDEIRCSQDHTQIEQCNAFGNAAYPDIPQTEEYTYFQLEKAYPNTQDGHPMAFADYCPYYAVSDQSEDQKMSLQERKDPADDDLWLSTILHEKTHPFVSSPHNYKNFLKRNGDRFEGYDKDHSGFKLPKKQMYWNYDALTIAQTRDSDFTSRILLIVYAIFLSNRYGNIWLVLIFASCPVMGISCHVGAFLPEEKEEPKIISFPGNTLCSVAFILRDHITISINELMLTASINSTFNDVKGVKGTKCLDHQTESLTIVTCACSGDYCSIEKKFWENVRRRAAIRTNDLDKIVQLNAQLANFNWINISLLIIVPVVVASVFGIMIPLYIARKSEFKCRTFWTWFSGCFGTALCSEGMSMFTLVFVLTGGKQTISMLTGFWSLVIGLSMITIQQAINVDQWKLDKTMWEPAIGMAVNVIAAASCGYGGISVLGEDEASHRANLFNSISLMLAAVGVIISHAITWKNHVILSEVNSPQGSRRPSDNTGGAAQGTVSGPRVPGSNSRLEEQNTSAASAPNALSRLAPNVARPEERHAAYREQYQMHVIKRESNSNK